MSTQLQTSSPAHTKDPLAAGYVDDAIDYANDIVEGRIVACRAIQNACKLFLTELEMQDNDDFPWMFDEARAQKFLDFCGKFKFYDGELVGEHVKFEPWTVFCLAPIFGWVSKSNPEMRRYTEVILFIARKNWKTGICALIDLYELMFAPPYSEIYSTSPGLKQSYLSFNAGKAFIKTLPEAIQNRFNVISHQITYENGSKWIPCPDNPTKQDGFNPRCVTYDESAAITKREIIEVMLSGQGAQVSPLNIHITTGSYTRETYFYELYRFGKNMLEGISIQNDRMWFCLYELDDESEWCDTDALIKANPNYGKSVRKEFINSNLEKARALPATLQEFKIKNCNLFVSTAAAWVSPDCLTDPETIVPELDKSVEGYIAIDVALTDDLTAVQVTWPQEDGCYHTQTYSFIPEETLEKTASHILPIYREAIDKGEMFITEGDIADPVVICNFVKKLYDEHVIVDVAYDPHKMSWIATELNNVGVPISPFSQGPLQMSPAFEETTRLLTGRLIKTTGSRLLQWQLSNCEVKTYEDSGIRKLVKGRDRVNKIDNMVSLVMTVGRASVGAATRPRKRGWALI